MPARITETVPDRTELFARVLPVTGAGLDKCTVAVTGDGGGPLVMMLAGCGVRRWVVGDDPAASALGARVAAHYGPGLGLEWTGLAPAQWSAAAARADLVLAVDDPAAVIALPDTAPRLLVMTPGAGHATAAVWALPGERLVAVPHTPRPCDSEAWATAAPVCAALAKALLLRATPYAPPGWEPTWAGDVRAYHVGGDPCAATWGATPDPALHFQPPGKLRRTLLVVGLGSLGSTAAHLLAPSVARLVLVDPDRVEIANVARQAAGANCWIGGLVVEAGEGGAAYAVTTPGQVWAWPVGQIRAAEDRTKSGAGAWGGQEQTAL